MPLFGRKKKPKDSENNSQDASSKKGTRSRPVISAPLVSKATQSDFEPAHTSQQQSEDICEPGYSIIKHSLHEKSGEEEMQQEEEETGGSLKGSEQRGATQQPVTIPHLQQQRPRGARHDSRYCVRGSAHLGEHDGEGSALPSITSVQEGSEDSFSLRTPPTVSRGESRRRLQEVAEGEELYSRIEKEQKEPRNLAVEHVSAARARGSRRTVKKRSIGEENELLRCLSHQTEGSDRGDKRRGGTEGKMIFQGKQLYSKLREEPAEELVREELDGSWSGESDSTVVSGESSSYDGKGKTKVNSPRTPAYRPPSSGKRKKGGPNPLLVPVIHPDTLAPSSPINPYAPYEAGYVFSKREPDGSLQYYAATPALSPKSPAPPAAPPSSPGFRMHAISSNNEAFCYPVQGLPSTCSWPCLTNPFTEGRVQGLGSSLTLPVPVRSEPLMYTPPTSKPLLPSPNPLNQQRTNDAPFATPTAGVGSPLLLSSRPASSPPRPSPRKKINEMKEEESSTKGLLQTVSVANDIKFDDSAMAVPKISQVEQDNAENHNRTKPTLIPNVSLQREIQDKLDSLGEESRSLKVTVLKLTEELNKHSRPVADQHDLSPADTYGVRSAEKDQILKLKADVIQLKDEITKLQKENQEVAASKKHLEKSTAEWLQRVDQAKQVMEENVTLMKQLELEKTRLEEMKKEHQATVLQLTTELSSNKKKREALENHLESIKESHLHVEEELKHVLVSKAAQVPLEEHRGALKEFQSLLEGIAEKTEEDRKKQNYQLKSMKKEMKSLVKKLTDAKAVILQLEEKCTALQKSNRKAQEKVTELQCKLEASKDREVAAHAHLNSLVVQTEKALSERDTFAQIVRCQQTIRGEKDYLHIKPWTKFQHTTPSDGVRVKLQARKSSDRSEKRIDEVYHSEIQHLKSLLQKNQKDLAACVGIARMEEKLDITTKQASASMHSHT